MKKLVMVMAVVLMSAIGFAQGVETFRIGYVTFSEGSYKSTPPPVEQFKQCPDGWSIVTQGDKLVCSLGEDNTMMFNIVGRKLNKETGVTEYKLFGLTDGSTIYMYYFRNKAFDKFLEKEGITDLISLEFDIYLPTEQETCHLVTFDRK